MKTGPIAIIALMLAACLILGCVSDLKSVKQDPQVGTDAPAPSKGEPAAPNKAAPATQDPVAPASTPEKPATNPPPLRLKTCRKDRKRPEVRPCCLSTVWLE